MKRYNVESASGCHNCYAEEAVEGELVEYEAAQQAIRDAKGAERDDIAKLVRDIFALYGATIDKHVVADHVITAILRRP